MRAKTVRITEEEYNKLKRTYETYVSTQKKYREKNKDYYKEYHRKWQQNNKEKISQYQKEWRARKKQIDFNSNSDMLETKGEL